VYYTNTVKYLLILTFLFFYTFAFSEVLDKVAAIVGDEIILQSEIDQIVEHKKYNSRFGFDEAEFRNSVLEEMISNKVLYYTAIKDSTISVSDDEIQRVLDDRINSIIDQVGSEKRFEEMYNTTISDLKKQYRPEIRKNMFIEKLRNKNGLSVTVNKDEVEKFYETNKDSIPPVQASVTLSQLVIRFSDKALSESRSFEKLKDIKESILKGEISFEKAAEKYSDDEVSAVRGGSVGFTSRGDLVSEYERIAYSLNINEISDPVKSKFGFHLIKLNEKTGEKINTSHILLIPEKNVENDSTAYQFAIAVKDSIVNKKMTFEEAVRKYSGDEKTKYLDGRIGSLKIDEMDQKYAAMFGASEIGFLSDPVKEKDGYYIYKITDRTDDHQINMYSDYNLLKNMALERKRYRHIKKWIDELKKNVYIEIK